MGYINEVSILDNRIAKDQWLYRWLRKGEKWCYKISGNKFWEGIFKMAKAADSQMCLVEFLILARAFVPHEFWVLRNYS